jgi:lipopolysaccharide transport system permease protein
MTASTPGATVKTVVKPRRGWAGLDIGELWAYRELGFFFVWRDLKVRYKQTIFGVLWAVIQPVAFMIVFSFVLGRTPGIAPVGSSYPLFVFAALVPWTLVAQGVAGASESLVNSSNLIQKVFFPRLLIPAAAVFSYLLDFAIALVVLAVLFVGFGVTPTIRALWLAPLTALALSTALAVGLLLAAVNVRYRDVRYAVPFLIQLWLFASPIAYSSSAIPDEWRALYELNPVVGVVEGFRWALFDAGGPAPLRAILVSMLVTGAVLISGVTYFRRMERTFADVI